MLRKENMHKRLSFKTGLLCRLLYLKPKFKSLTGKIMPDPFQNWLSILTASFNNEMIAASSISSTDLKIL